MEACKYNVGEFKPFVSGKKKIKPEVSDDWEVFTGGFAKSTDVLNLTSPKLDQTIFDINSTKFFKFMLDEDVTMNGNKIVGRFVIGSQRVLRKEEDYKATMATITERKSTMIPKSDFKVGYRYETVCGSTFIFAGFRYIIKEVKSKTGIKCTKLTKTYLALGTSDYWNKSGISNVTSKKIVKELGFVQEESYLDSKIAEYTSIQQNKVIYCSKENTKPEMRLEWEERYTGGANVPEFVQNKEGYVFKQSHYHHSRYIFVLVDGIDGLTYDSEFTVEYQTGYYAKENKVIPVIPRWVY